MTDWGPEIEVNGKRPEWLREGVTIRFYNAVITDTWWDSPYHKGHGYKHADIVHWQGITHIRLPADHPHYKKDDVPDWAIERALGLSGRSKHLLDAIKAYPRDNETTLSFARYIAQHEEPPIDPLLLEARELTKVFFGAIGWSTQDYGRTNTTIQATYDYLKRKADAKQG